MFFLVKRTDQITNFLEDVAKIDTMANQETFLEHPTIESW